MWWGRGTATEITTTAMTTRSSTGAMPLRGRGFGTSRPWLPDCAGMRRTVLVPAHADRRGSESVVEAHARLQQAGDQRADERTEVDAQIKSVKPPSQRASRWRRGCRAVTRRWPSARQNQVPSTPGRHRRRPARADRQRDVTEHHHHTAVEHGAFHADQPVGDPAPERRRESPARRMLPRCRWRCSSALQSALGDQ